MSFETVTDQNTEQMLMRYIENIAVYVKHGAASGVAIDVVAYL